MTMGTIQALREGLVPGDCFEDGQPRIMHRDVAALLSRAPCLIEQLIERLEAEGPMPEAVRFGGARGEVWLTMEQALFLVVNAGGPSGEKVLQEMSGIPGAALLVSSLLSFDGAKAN